MTQPSFDVDEARKLGKLLLTGNPFYLISAALALYASTLLFDTANIWVESGVPIGILAGYTALCAATAIFIVKRGKVWDDAGTLLFIILTLPLALSVSLDDKLIDRPEVGAVWLAGSLLFVGGVSLWIRRGLNLRLGKFLWGVYAGLLAVFFLYPYLLSHLVIEFTDNKDPATWGIILFPVLFAVAMLPLLYPVNRGIFTPENGTPFRKLPIALFGILWLAGIVRTYLLSISFYAGKGQGGYGELESGFAGWMILPLLVAGVILLAEYLIVRKMTWQNLVWVVIGVLCVFFLFGSFGNPESQNRLQRVFFYLAWGRKASGFSPPLLASTVFLAYLGIRKVWWALPPALIALIWFLFAQFRPEFTMPVISGKTIALVVAGLIGIMLIVVALLKRNWITLLLLLYYVVAGAGVLLLRAEYLPGIYPILAAAVAVTLVVGWVVKQRNLQAAGLAAAVVFFIAMGIGWLRSPNWESGIYLAVIFAITLFHLRRGFWIPAVLEAAMLLVMAGVWGYRAIAGLSWKGGGVIFASLLFFAVAFGVSLFKAGILQRYCKRLRDRLRGT